MKEFDPKKSFMKLPFCADWIDYKGEVVFGVINYEATLKAKKPMIDICFCATMALNGIVDKTVQYDKSKFKSVRK